MPVFDLDKIREAESINEGTRSNINDNELIFIRFYQHALKWVYQRSHQEAKWANTILENSYKAGLITNTNTRKGLSAELYSLYLKGIDAANVDIRKDPKATLVIEPEAFVWNSFNSIDKIADWDYVVSTLSPYQNPNKEPFLEKKKKKV